MKDFLDRVAATRTEEQLEAVRAWRDVPARPRGLTAEQVARLRGLRAAGLSTRQCARALGVSQSRVMRGLRGES
jgi:DNA invertase Pin-like site-specific DNA recombinase